MADTAYERHGVRILLLDVGGPPLADSRGASDLVGAAWGQNATMVVLPARRATDAFFNLRGGLAGEVIQKFVNYRLRLVILGDIAAHLAASSALRDFVYESNRGEHVWFMDHLDDLDRRLERPSTGD